MEDYLPAIKKVGLARWHKPSMPIAVHIEQTSSATGFKRQYVEILQKAWLDWAEACSSTITCLFVTRPEQAQIVCKWTDKKEDLPTTFGNSCAGGTYLYIISDRLKRAEMRILTVPPTLDYSNNIPDNVMRHTALHEVGHALGLTGHSDHWTDIMFPAVSPICSLSSPSKRDINTVLALYALDQTEMTKHRFDPRNANAFTPNSQMGQLVNEGIAAMKGGDFYRAISKLEQASKLQPTNKFVKQHLGFAYCQCGTKELTTFNFADAALYFTKGIPLFDK